MTARSSWRAAFRAISLSCTLMTELLGTSSPWKKWIPFRRLQLERIELNGYTFQCDRDGNVWVTDGSGLQARLAEFDAFTQRGFLPSEIQAYPVPQGIRVIVYAKFDYEMDYAHTYSLQTLNTLLGGGRPAQTGISVSIDGVPVPFPAAPYQVKGCTWPLCGLWRRPMGYTFSYNAVTGTACMH